VFDGATQDKLYQDLHALALQNAAAQGIAQTGAVSNGHNVAPEVLTADAEAEVIAESA
jgi:hypothetical protein